jgi:hypothetical protein
MQWIRPQSEEEKRMEKALSEMRENLRRVWQNSLVDRRVRRENGLANRNLRRRRKDHERSD